jgi:hypothetical protein
MTGYLSFSILCVSIEQDVSLPQLHQFRSNDLSTNTQVLSLKLLKLEG